MEEDITLVAATSLAAKKKTKESAATKTVKTKKQISEKANQTISVTNTNTEVGIANTDINTIQNLNLDWNNPSWDLFLLAFFVIGALLYGISLGKDRIIAILVSIYMALAVVNAMPDFVLNIKMNNNFNLQVTAFVSIFVILFFLLSRSAVFNSLDTSQQGKWWQVIIFSILHVGLLISVAMSFIPTVFIQKFSPLTQTIFVNEWAAFGWIIAPIIAMIIFGRRHE